MSGMHEGSSLVSEYLVLMVLLPGQFPETGEDIQNIEESSQAEGPNVPCLGLRTLLLPSLGHFLSSLGTELSNTWPSTWPTVLRTDMSPQP